MEVSKSAGRAPLRWVTRAGPPSVHALGIALASLPVLLAAALLPLDAPPLSLFACPLRAATGVPCLSCGATHAFHFALRGQLVAALLANPLAALAALALALHCALTLLRLCGLPFAPAVPRPSPRSATLLRAGGLAALAANWLFVLLRDAR